MYQAFAAAGLPENVTTAASRTTLTLPDPVHHAGSEPSAVNSSLLSLVWLSPRISWIFRSTNRAGFAPLYTRTRWPSRNPSASQPSSLLPGPVIGRISCRSALLNVTAPSNWPIRVRWLRITPSFAVLAAAPGRADVSVSTLSVTDCT